MGFQHHNNNVGSTSQLWRWINVTITTLDQRHIYDWINVTIMTLDQRHNLDVYPTNKSNQILIQRHGLTLDQRHIYDFGSTSQLWLWINVTV